MTLLPKVHPATAQSVAAFFRGDDVRQFHELMTDIARDNPAVARYIRDWCRHFGLSGDAYLQAAGLAAAVYKLLDSQAEADQLALLLEGKVA